MFIRSIETAVCDTDMLGHINNTRLPVWFEMARNDIFHIFNPDPEALVWNLLTARVEIDYLGQIFSPTPSKSAPGYPASGIHPSRLFTN